MHENCGINPIFPQYCSEIAALRPPAKPRRAGANDSPPTGPNATMCVRGRPNPGRPLAVRLVAP